jgi:hypothetical protein
MDKEYRETNFPLLRDSSTRNGGKQKQKAIYDIPGNTFDPAHRMVQNCSNATALGSVEM